MLLNWATRIRMVCARSRVVNYGTALRPDRTLRARRNRGPSCRYAVRGEADGSADRVEHGQDFEREERARREAADHGSCDALHDLLARAGAYVDGLVNRRKSN